MPYETVVSKTIEYLAIPSVVGHEKIFGRYLAKDFEKLGLRVREYRGILEVSPQNPNSQIISAHIDRHGLISIGEGKYQYAARNIKQYKYGEKNSSAKAVLNSISKRFDGERVFAYDPETGDHLGEGEIERCDTVSEKGRSIFYIKNVKPMAEDIPIAYARSATSDGKHLKGQIDNVVSIGMIYTLFQNGFQGTALFSKEEEIGKSWIHIANWLKVNKRDTKELIILDTSPYREAAPIEGGLVVLRNRDKSSKFNTKLVRKIKKRAEALLIPYQVKDEYFISKGLKTKDLGSTELGHLVKNYRGRWSGATVQIPTMEYHTSYETTSRGCIESYYSLLHSILVVDKITS